MKRKGFSLRMFSVAPTRRLIGALICLCLLGSGSTSALGAVGAEQLAPNQTSGPECLVGIDGDSGLATSFELSIYDVDPTTGAASNQRKTGIAGKYGAVGIGLVFGPGGNLYTVTAGAMAEAILYRLNPITGASQTIGPLNIGWVNEGDLAVHPQTGQLYSII